MKKVNFVWSVADWKWEASEYQGNGIFFGKVTSPIVPDGEYGTWYLWEIEQNGAKLIKGDISELNILKEKIKKDTTKLQKAILG
jgi:hypothetical protein